MKRIICLFSFLAISFILVSACAPERPADEDWEPSKYESVNTLDGVTMKVKEETVTPTGLTVTLENHSEKRCIYSEDFLLEKKMDGEWREVPILPGATYGFEEPGYELNPLDVSDWTADWEWLYGSLESGEYRIVKGVLDVREPGDFDEHPAAAEFTIE